VELVQRKEYMTAWKTAPMKALKKVVMMAQTTGHYLALPKDLN
jgi:hypothetical protein